MQEFNPIKPGAGLIIEQIPLAPIRRELREGTFVIDPAMQEQVDETLADQDATIDQIRAVLNMPSAKALRNGYTSIVMETIWPSYTAQVDGEEPSLHAISFDHTTSSIRKLPPQKLDILPQDLARLIAASNQNVPTHYICEEFRDGRVPVISGDPAKDIEYLEAFRKQTDLTMRAGNFFVAVPNQIDSTAKFISSGLRVLRTHVFGLPNLIDGVAEREGVELNPIQHRTSVDVTLRSSITPYYLPTGPLTIAANTRLTHQNTGELEPKSWASNGNPDRYVVFPSPTIIQEVNAAASRQDLPAQTNCPAFHSRVETAADSSALPLPRSLANLALKQLDSMYYPLRTRLAEQRKRIFTVPEMRSTVQNTSSFSRGIFEPGKFTMDKHVAPNEHEDAPPLTPKEQNILRMLGHDSGNTKSFSSFMSDADEHILTQEFGNKISSIPEHEELQRLFRRTLVSVDGAFDVDREAFKAAATSGASTFLAALYDIKIDRFDSLDFTAGEAFRTFGKRSSDPKIYSKTARSLIQQGYDAFMKVGVAEVGRRDSSQATSIETQQIKETTNGLYAGLLFDIAYGSFVENSAYWTARDRYIAAKLAYQYNDEILDIVSDAAEGSANLLNATAKETGEDKALIAAHDILSGLISDTLNDPSTIIKYYEAIQSLAPQSYAKVVARQHELLATADLPLDIIQRIKLPAVL